MANVFQLMQEGIKKKNWKKIAEAMQAMADSSEVEVVQPASPKKRGRPRKQATGIDSNNDNRFTPEMASTLCTEYSSDGNPTPRMRPPTKYVEVVCSGCGVKETVSEALAIRRVNGELVRYKCNKCSCAPGR